VFHDIEREIEAKLIRGFRRIFEFDDQFRYNTNMGETGVVITPSFPDKEFPFKVPHIVIAEIGFDYNPEFSLSNNFYSDLAHNGIMNYGTQHVSTIPYSASLICLAEYDMSRNLANRAFYYASFRAYEYLSNILKLNLKGISKSPTSMREQYPEKIFQTAVNIRGVANYMVTKTPFNYLTANESSSIDRLGEKFNDIKQNISIKDDTNDEND